MKTTEKSNEAATTIEKVEEMVKATNLTPEAALEQIKRTDAAKAKKAKKPISAAKAKKVVHAIVADIVAKKKAVVAKKAAKPAAKKAAKKTAVKKGAKPATGKGATILAMIARKGGATATELQNATGWQAHSVRGFLSVANKKGLAKVASAKREDGQRVYSA
jgi:hypothetical protein